MKKARILSKNACRKSLGQFVHKIGEQPVAVDGVDIADEMPRCGGRPRVVILRDRAVHERIRHKVLAEQPSDGGHVPDDTRPRAARGRAAAFLDRILREVVAQRIFAEQVLAQFRLADRERRDDTHARQLHERYAAAP